MDTTANQPKSEQPGPRVIKRYANRKLYDTRDSRYVTLQQIAEYVRVGEDVQIIDNTTKEDLTNVTLAQIIYEEEKKGDSETRSLKHLRSIIQSSGERLMTSLRDGPLGKLVTRREGEEGELGLEGEETELSTVEAEGEGARGVNRSVVAQSRDALDQLQRTADDRVRSLVAAAMTHVQQLQAEVRRLQGRIEELEDRLVKITKKGRKDSEAPEPPSDEAGGGAA